MLKQRLDGSGEGEIFGLVLLSTLLFKEYFIMHFSGPFAILY
jgi:hypothetical protein